MSAAPFGTLYLVPVPIGSSAPDAVLPAATLGILRRLDLFFAESAKTARAVLGAAGLERPLQQVEIHEFAGDTRRDELAVLLDAMRGRDAGVISEAGAPGVADPGAILVRVARERGIEVVACNGPSALLLALMGSGLEGQRFAFHGYLPIEMERLRESVRALERASERDRATQIFIETPYRNDRMLAAVVECSREDTLLAVAAGLDTDGAFTRTDTIAGWRARPVVIGKRPAVFMLLARPRPEARRGGDDRRPRTRR